MPTHLRPMAQAEVETWRKKYRKRLGIPVVPDFYEALCQMGKGYLLEELKQGVGYAILTSETMLAGQTTPLISEFYLETESAKDARGLLLFLLKELRPLSLLARTDDLNGFPLLMDLHFPNSVACALYQLKQSIRWSREEGMEIVPSTIADAQELAPIYASVPPEDGGIPDEISLTKSVALWRHYRLMIGGETAAVCYVVPQTEQCVTVAPLVLTAFRGRGYGRYLTAYAANREFAEGKTLIAAARIENDAGRGLWESLHFQLAAHFLEFKPDLDIG